jgi:microcystin-dependent protein
MADPFIGEIRMFGFNFAPSGWAFCNGQILPISGNEALFTLLGTTYGGNGVTNFGLPNLQSRIPLHQGQRSGGPFQTLGQMDGVEQVSLSLGELAVHSHPLRTTSTAGNSQTPAAHYVAPDGAGRIAPYSSTRNTQMASPLPVGGNQPHDNMPPYLVVNFCIALNGIFPSRS